MTLYHGSVSIVENPEIRDSFRTLDFSVGFYTTSSYEQALKWANNKMKQTHAKHGYVNVYEFDEERAKKDLKINVFKKDDNKWFDYVYQCRSGILKKTNCDIDIGPVADDNVYETIRLYEQERLNVSEAIFRLKAKKLFDQFTFHTEKSLSYLKFKNYDVIPQTHELNDDSGYPVLLSIYVGGLVKYIIGKENISDIDAVRRVYDSKLYTYLADETTKVWYYSTPTLYTILQYEEKDHLMVFPDV